MQNHHHWEVCPRSQGWEMVGAEIRPGVSEALQFVVSTFILVWRNTINMIRSWGKNTWCLETVVPLPAGSMSVYLDVSDFTWLLRINAAENNCSVPTVWRFWHLQSLPGLPLEGTAGSWILEDKRLCSSLHLCHCLSWGGQAEVAQDTPPCPVDPSYLKPVSLCDNHKATQCCVWGGEEALLSWTKWLLAFF